MKANFPHVYLPGKSDRTLLLLHGTGGSENDLIPLGRTLDPDAALLSPRGKVLENGMPRFFRRLAEGVFDEEDLINRTHELADFLGEMTDRHSLVPGRMIAVGYSNGANIASSMLLLLPGTLGGAALLRGMLPLVPEVLPDLQNAPVLIAAGHQDPIVPSENVRRLATLLKNAGADVTLRFENAAHGLTSLTVETTKQWLEGQPPA